MRLFRWTALAVGVVALFACTEVLKSGRCNQTSDCAAMQAYGAGYVCNNDLTLQGDGRCVPRCLTSSECTGGRICDSMARALGAACFLRRQTAGEGTVQAMMSEAVMLTEEGTLRSVPCAKGARRCAWG
jgi:hypothetical protein